MVIWFYLGTFLILFLLSLFTLKTKSKFIFLKKKNTSFLISFIFSIAWIIYLYSLNGFKLIHEHVNNNILNVIAMSYVIINITIILLLLVFLIFSPILIYNNVQILILDTIKVKWKSIFIIIFISLSFFGLFMLFKKTNISIDYYYPIIDINNFELLSIYKIVNGVVNFMFKSDYSSWIYIIYFFIIFLTSFFIKKIKNNTAKIINFDSKKVLKNTSEISISISFLALTNTIIINPLSTVYRSLIFILFISLLFFLFWLFWKNNIIKLSLLEFEKYINIILIPISFVMFLSLSNESVFKWKEVINYLNFIISFLISILINILIFINNEKLSLYSRLCMTYNTNYIVSGVNTSFLPFIMIPTIFIFKKLSYFMDKKNILFTYYH